MLTVDNSLHCNLGIIVRFDFNLPRHMQSQLWVGLVGQIIVIRTRGMLTVQSVFDRHERAMQIAKESGSKNILFDFLEAEVPTYEVKEAQKGLNAELQAQGFRVAVVVPNPQLAYHARMVFGDKNHRIVYEDLAAATRWLSECI